MNQDPVHSRRLYSLLESQYLKYLVREDLTIPEMIALQVIASLGTPTIVEFSRAMNISQSNATYLIHKLEHKGFLEKKASFEDKRVSHLMVTQKYRERLAFFEKYLESDFRQVTADLTKQERAIVQKYNDLLIRKFIRRY